MNAVYETKGKIGNIFKRLLGNKASIASERSSKVP